MRLYVGRNIPPPCLQHEEAPRRKAVMPCRRLLITKFRRAAARCGVLGNPYRLPVGGTPTGPDCAWAGTATAHRSPDALLTLWTPAALIIGV